MKAGSCLILNCEPLAKTGRMTRGAKRRLMSAPEIVIALNGVEATETAQEVLFSKTWFGAIPYFCDSDNGELFLD